jgi:hypothetical protein
MPLRLELKGNAQMNRPTNEMIEAGARAIWAEFIKQGSGSLMATKYEGKVLVDGNGRPILETPAQAMDRRWYFVPEAKKAEYRNEARECIMAAMRVRTNDY